jgi:PST family polysaccharide transporter
VRPADTLVVMMVGIIAAGNIFQAFNAIDLWFQSQVQSKYTVYAKSTAFLLISIVKIILILSGAPLISFALAALIEVFLGAIGMIVVYNLNGHILRAWQASWAYSKEPI